MTVPDWNWPLLVASFAITLVLFFSGPRVRRAAQDAQLASAPLLGQLWRTMPLKALVFLAVLGGLLRRAALGGLLVVAIGFFIGGGFILLADRIPNVPFLGKLLAFLLVIVGGLVFLAAGTLGTATFLTLAWDGFLEASELFGL